MAKKTNIKKSAKKQDNRFFDGLMEGLQQAAAHARGEIELPSYYVPGPVNVKGIRTKLNLSQSEFAGRYGFPIRTLQDWELGRNQPPGPVRAYLLVIEKKPSVVAKVLKGAA